MSDFTPSSVRWKVFTQDGRKIALGPALPVTHTDSTEQDVGPITRREPRFAWTADGRNCRIVYTGGMASPEFASALSDDLDSVLRETELMNPTLVKISAAVQRFDLKDSSFWPQIERRFEKARLFAIECEPTSIELHDFNRFDGRARVLLQLPQKLRSGREVIGSAAVAALVGGHIDRSTEIQIDEFRIPNRPA